MRTTNILIQKERNYMAKIARGLHRTLLRKDMGFEYMYQKNELDSKEEALIPYANKVIGCIGLALLMFIASCIHSKPVHAYTDEQAIKTIVGEASNQGLIGMTAVAEVIRTKGSLKGFYGFKATHSAKEPIWVWKMARKAWFASKTSNLTKGADHFENISAFGCPSWSKNCVITFRYKDHVFMKEVRV